MSQLTIISEEQLRPGDRLLTERGVETVGRIGRRLAPGDPITLVYGTCDAAGKSDAYAVLPGSLIAVEAPAQHEVQAWWDALDAGQRRALVAHDADDLLRAREDVAWHEACDDAELKGMAAALDGQPSAPTPSPEGSYGLELCYEMGYAQIIGEAHSDALIEHHRRALAWAAIPVQALLIAEETHPILAESTVDALRRAAAEIDAVLAASHPHKESA